MSAQTTALSHDKVLTAATEAKKKNDIPSAIQLYSQALAQDPQWSTGWWSLALLQYSTRQWPAAIVSFTHYIKLIPEDSPTSAQAIALRGLCESETDDDQQSLADLETAIQLNSSDDPDTDKLLRYHQALMFTRLGRFEEALGVYSYLARAGRAEPSWNISVGLAGLRSPQLPSQVDAVQQPIFAAAGDAALHYMQGDQPFAAKEFDDFFIRFPGVANAHYLYGFLMLSSDPDATIHQYEEELKVAPANATAAGMLAWVLLAQEQPAQAAPYAQKAVDESPTWAVAQLVLGRSLAETGNLGQGISHLETALNLQPHLLETHVALASAYAASGRDDDARREREQSLLIAKETIAHP